MLQALLSLLSWRPTRRRRAIAITVLLAGPLLVIAGLYLALLILPYPEGQLHARFSESRRILDRQGRLLRESANQEGARARWTSLDGISELVISATIAVEDEHFWEHRGIDLPAVTRAVLQNLDSGRVVSGASTITMQLARLKAGHPRSVAGKLLQAFDALRLERALDKREILEQYLNRASYGAGTIGVEAASRRIFGKPTRHLSLAEAAMLSGLPQAPTLLNPLRSPEAASRRQHTVLTRLLATGAITQDDHDRALREPLQFIPQPPALSAMHFTDWMLAEGLPPGEVGTTIDLDLQQQIERLVAEHVRSMAAGGLTNAAVVVLDNRDCSLLAMVGSADYWAGTDGAVNGAIARRQPGSALKPFTYALAFSKGLSPASVAADIKTEYMGANGTFYSPQNYSDQFSGPVLLAEALGRSLNVPAIRLANTVGIDQLLAHLRAAGFASLDQEAGHYGLGLTLGNGEVTLLELAGAYAMLANSGRARPLRTLVDEPPAESRQVFSAEVSFLITDILSDEALRIRAFGAATPLLLPFAIAVKTGTSNNWRDSWAIGYTERHTVAIWTGDFGGGSMDQLSGSLGAGPLFHRVARLVVERGSVQTLPEPIAAPDGVEQVLVCALSGNTPTPACPHRRAVTLLSGLPRPDCDWHQQLPIDRRNGLLASNRCPAAHVTQEMFEILPPRYAEWQSQHATHQPPTRYSPLCPAHGLTADALVITNPRRAEVYLLEPGYDRETQSLQLRGEVHPALPEVTWLVDGKPIAEVGWPYEATWQLESGSHQLQMAAGGKASDPVTFEVR